MDGKSSASVSFAKDSAGNYLKAGTTYYVAETDSSGNAITNGKDALGCTISISNKKVTMTASDMEPGSTITNSYSDDAHAYDPGSSTKLTSAGSASVKTGDDFNAYVWILIGALGLAGALALIEISRKRLEKKPEKDKEQS